MAEKLTIQERIAQQLVLTVDAALPDWLANEVTLGAVTASDRTRALEVLAQRFEPRGSDLPWFVPYVITGPGDVVGESTGMGNGGWYTMSYLYKFQVQFGSIEGVDISAATGNPARGVERMGSRWVGFFIEKLLADDKIVEGATGNPLATGIDLVGHDTPRSKVAGQVVYVPEVELEVSCEVKRNDPYVGAGAPEREV